MMGQVRSGRGGQGHPPHRPTECKPLHSASNSLPPGNHGDQDWATRDCRDLTTRPRVMNPITGRLTMSNMAAAWLLAPCETGLLSGRLVAVVAVCSGRECIDCVPHSLLLLPAPLCHQSSTPPPLAAATATITRTTSAWRQSCCASDQTRFYFHGHHIKK